MAGELISFYPRKIELFRGFFYDFCINTDWNIKSIRTTLPDYLVQKESDRKVRIKGIVSVPANPPDSPYIIIIESFTGTAEDIPIIVDVIEDLRESNPFWRMDIELDSGS